jgi:hypothetical protein
MLAGLPVPAEAVTELAHLVRAEGGDELADRLERAVADDVKLLALTLDERAIMLSSLEDPPKALAELRAVLVADHPVAAQRRARLVPAWATVALSAITAATALLAVWLQNRYAERSRKQEAREQRIREAAHITGAVLDLLSDGHPDRLAVNVRREEPFADYNPLHERWNELRPAVLRFALAHPSPAMRQLGESLIAAVWQTLSRSALLLGDLARDRGDIIKGREEASEHHAEAVGLARRMMDTAHNRVSGE